MLSPCPACQALTNSTWQRCPVCQHILGDVSEMSPPARQGGQEATHPVHDVRCDTPTRSPTAIAECGGHHVPQPVTQTMSFWEHPEACYACGTRRRWRSSYGAVVCERCHPPPDAAAVAAWEE